MKRLGVLMLTVIVSTMVLAPAFSSDWDKAGKALTITEGIRLITGGNVDVIGSITGINRQRGNEYARRGHHDDYGYRRHHHDQHCYEKVWVTHYCWRKEYVPEHTEYRHGLGEVVVEGHYIRYQAEDGGYWETKYRCGY